MIREVGTRYGRLHRGGSTTMRILDRERYKAFFKAYFVCLRRWSVFTS